MISTCYMYVMGRQWPFITTAVIEISWILPNLYQRYLKQLHIAFYRPHATNKPLSPKYKPIYDSSMSKILTARPTETSRVPNCSPACVEPVSLVIYNPSQKSFRTFPRWNRVKQPCNSMSLIIRLSNHAMLNKEIGGCIIISLPEIINTSWQFFLMGPIFHILNEC